jgi:hypothetical protein
VEGGQFLFAREHAVELDPDVSIEPVQGNVALL